MCCQCAPLLFRWDAFSSDWNDGNSLYNKNNASPWIANVCYAASAAPTPLQTWCYLNLNTHYHLIIIRKPIVPCLVFVGGKCIVWKRHWPLSNASHLVLWLRCCIFIHTFKYQNAPLCIAIAFAFAAKMFLNINAEKLRFFGPVLVMVRLIDSVRLCDCLRCIRPLHCIWPYRSFGHDNFHHRTHIQSLKIIS